MFIHRIVSIRLFIVILMTFVLLLAIPGTGFFMIRSAQQALLDEKQSKLFGLAALMDTGLEQSFDHILGENQMMSAPRGAQIRFLNNALKASTDRIAHTAPGIGVGYYSRLDAIITYGPSSDLGRKVGQSISRTHLGREVMRTGRQLVQTASLVRGKIMNCMYPIHRNGEVIGYIWANELVEDINLQMEQMTRKFHGLIILGVLLSIAGTALIAQTVSVRVNRIKNGLKQIQGDLDWRIPPIPGEFGEIGEAVNELAGALSERKRLEAQMQRADRLAALGEVAAGVAHEVRNPITAIKGRYSGP